MYIFILHSDGIGWLVPFSFLKGNKNSSLAEEGDKY